MELNERIERCETQLHMLAAVVRALLALNPALFAALQSNKERLMAEALASSSTTDASNDAAEKLLEMLVGAVQVPPRR